MPDQLQQEPTDEQQLLLTKHLELVIQANKVTNLTRIEDMESGQLLHVEDSLVGLPEVSDAPEGRYADLGTGGGFPGIPLAIMTGRDTLLVDSVKKKVAILTDIVSQLGLENQIKGYGGRIEDLSIEEKGTFSVLTARALSSLSSLCELASPLLQQGGRLVCYKARVTDEELEHVIELRRKLAMKIVSDRELYLSDGETLRRIIVFEKSGYPEIKLPRRIGLAQKKPL